MTLFQYLGNISFKILSNDNKLDSFEIYTEMAIERCLRRNFQMLWCPRYQQNKSVNNIVGHPVVPISITSFFRLFLWRWGRNDTCHATQCTHINFGWDKRLTNICSVTHAHFGLTKPKYFENFVRYYSKNVYSNNHNSTITST